MSNNFYGLTSKAEIIKRKKQGENISRTTEVDRAYLVGTDYQLKQKRKTWRTE